MWWFSTADLEEPGNGGRFDLAPPNGSCYLATTSSTAILEALQRDFSGGLLPVSALRARSISSITVPDSSPVVANLTSASGAGLWADSDRLLTQR
jgi:hypothetical protein